MFSVCARALLRKVLSLSIPHVFLRPRADTSVHAVTQGTAATHLHDDEQQHACAVATRPAPAEKSVWTQNPNATSATRDTCSTRDDSCRDASRLVPTRPGAAAPAMAAREVPRTACHDRSCPCRAPQPRARAHQSIARAARRCGAAAAAPRRAAPVAVRRGRAVAVRRARGCISSSSSNS